MVKNNNNKTVMIIIGIIILFLLMRGCNQTPAAVGNGTQSAGGSSGGGSSGGGSQGGDLTPANTCAEIASLNNFAYYKSPITSRMGCSVYAFEDCTRKGQVTNGISYSDSLDCCVWNCKAGNTDRDDCTDTDGGVYPLVYGYVNDDNTQTSYPDNCIQESFTIYLKEQYCENGIRKETTIDCWTEFGGICGNGRCYKPSCEEIISPGSQTDCDLGSPCQNTGEETYCKYVPATTGAPSRCACTIEPSSVNSCERACWFNGFVSGYCYEGKITKNPCGFNTYVPSGNSFCPRYQTTPTCCCG